jgi:hypothetical protein
MENVLPVDAAQRAYGESTRKDGDLIQGDLYTAKALGQTAGLGLTLAGAKSPTIAEPKSGVVVESPREVGSVVPDRQQAITGETTSTSVGKQVHKEQADIRRESGQFSIVEQPIKDKAGNTILVPKRVDLKTGVAQPGAKLQKAVPDAANFDRRLIVDDKPIGRPIAKDRQEIIRFIKAFEQREGVLPEVIGIQRYDSKTGVPVRTDLHSPHDFLPKKK